MAGLFLGIVYLTGIASLVCWIIVLTKMFPESVGKGILGVICALYAFVWGWQNRASGLVKVMPIWTACIIGSIVVRILGAALLDKH